MGNNFGSASNSGGNDGIGFAIPINLAIRIANELLVNGKISRPFLGVKFDANAQSGATVVPSMQEQGAKVRAVSPDSPATEAGVLPGDVITLYNGVLIESHSHLANLVALTPVGKSVPITVFRQGKPYELLVHLQEKMP